MNKGLTEQLLRSTRPNPETGCWEWTKYRSKTGYGDIRVSRKTLRVHRLSFELFNGPIPEGLVVRHKCDNPPCVNPGHLELGTQAQNLEDMRARGRHGMSARTHCPRGHLLTGENLVPCKLRIGRRQCLTCERSRKRPPK